MPLRPVWAAIGRFFASLFAGAASNAEIRATWAETLKELQRQVEQGTKRITVLESQLEECREDHRRANIKIDRQSVKIEQLNERIISLRQVDHRQQTEITAVKSAVASLSDSTLGKLPPPVTDDGNGSTIH